MGNMSDAQIQIQIQMRNTVGNSDRPKFKPKPKFWFSLIRCRNQKTEMSAETDTKTENFRQLVGTVLYEHFGPDNI